MKSFITGPFDLQGKASQELIKLTEDVEEARESSLRIKGELLDTEPLGDRLLGDVSNDDIEDDESIDSR